MQEGGWWDSQPRQMMGIFIESDLDLCSRRGGLAKTGIFPSHGCRFGTPWIIFGNKRPRIRAYQEGLWSHWNVYEKIFKNKKVIAVQVPIAIWFFFALLCKNRRFCGSTSLITESCCSTICFFIDFENSWRFSTIYNFPRFTFGCQKSFHNFLLFSTTSFFRLRRSFCKTKSP